MLTRKLMILTAALAVSAPALADRGNHYGHDKHRKHVVVQHHYVQHRYVQHRPVVRHYYYRPAPRPVVVVHRPQPVYPAAAVLVGAIIGGAIVHHAITGY